MRRRYRRFHVKSLTCPYAGKTTMGMYGGERRCIEVVDHPPEGYRHIGTFHGTKLIKMKSGKYKKVDDYLPMSYKHASEIAAAYESDTGRNAVIVKEYDGYRVYGK